MKPKHVGLALTFCALSAGMLFAFDPNLGKWELTPKSRIAPGMAKSTLVTYQLDGDKVAVHTEGVDAKGNKFHSQWVGKYDGNDYPLTGDPTADMQSIKQLNGNKFALTMKKNGKVVITGTIEFVGDGTRTVITYAKDVKRKTVMSVAYYVKAHGLL